MDFSSVIKKGQSSSNQLRFDAFVVVVIVEVVIVVAAEYTRVGFRFR